MNSLAVWMCTYVAWLTRQPLTHFSKWMMKNGVRPGKIPDIVYHKADQILSEWVNLLVAKAMRDPSAWGRAWSMLDQGGHYLTMSARQRSYWLGAIVES